MKPGWLKKDDDGNYINCGPDDPDRVIRTTPDERQWCAPQTRAAKMKAARDREESGGGELSPHLTKLIEHSFIMSHRPPISVWDLSP